jgi:hypothetical protein
MMIELAVDLRLDRRAAGDERGVSPASPDLPCGFTTRFELEQKSSSN